MISRRDFLALTGGLLVAPSALGAQDVARARNAQRGNAGPRTDAPLDPLVPLHPWG